MATTHTVSTADLLFICVQTDQLILVSDHLKGVYETKAHQLDKEHEKLRVGLTNTIQGVQAQNLPEDEIQLRKFIFPNSRDTAFGYLFERVDFIVTVTAGARRFHDRNSNKFNRSGYNLLVEEEEKIGDGAALLDLKNEIADLLNLIRKLKKLLN